MSRPKGDGTVKPARGGPHKNTTVPTQVYNSAIAITDSVVSPSLTFKTIGSQPRHGCRRNSLLSKASCARSPPHSLLSLFSPPKGPTLLGILLRKVVHDHHLKTEVRAILVFSSERE